MKFLLKKGKECLFYKHGMSNSGTYRTWAKMRNRCFNKNAPVFKWYGARGIKICRRWGKFENFVKDMGVRPKNKTLDRIDNEKGYSKSNCQWSTMAVQNRNRRSTRILELNGEKKCLSDWARSFGISNTTLDRRLKKGLSLSVALNL